MNTTTKPNQLKMLFMLPKSSHFSFELSRRVYSIKGIAPTLNTGGSGGVYPKICIAVPKNNSNKPK